MPYFRCKFDKQSPQYLYKWDFTKSLVDEIQGYEAIVSSGATRDSNGVHIVYGKGGQIQFFWGETSIYLANKTIEIDLSTELKDTNTHNTLVSSNGGDVDFHRGSSSSRWIVFNSGILDYEYSSTQSDFSNATIKIVTGNVDDNLKIYADDVLIYDGKSFVNIGPQSLSIGNYSKRSTFANMDITAVRIYENI